MNGNKKKLNSVILISRLLKHFCYFFENFIIKFCRFSQFWKHLQREANSDPNYFIID